MFEGTYSQLRHRLRQAREERGLTQAQLALKIGSSPKFVIEYENGTHVLEVGEMLMVSFALGLDPTRVLSGAKGGEHDGQG